MITRVCYRNSDGRIEEEQAFAATHGTLLQNRTNAGQNPNDYTEVAVDDAGLATLRAASPADLMPEVATIQLTTEEISTALAGVPGASAAILARQQAKRDAGEG
jgi:hypothetical protein